MCAGHSDIGTTDGFLLGFLQAVPRLGCRKWAGGAIIRPPVTESGVNTHDWGREGVPVKRVWLVKLSVLCFIRDPPSVGVLDALSSSLSCAGPGPGRGS